VALCGYFAAAFLVDKVSVGRLRLQQYGFLIAGFLFCICGWFKNQLSSFWLVVFYFGSSFFGQCGPNCTTFLIPTEVFPTEMRTMCHGISAAAGKAGALCAAILFNFVNEKDLFLISGYCSFVGMVVTWITIPETCTLDLYELDKKWQCILSEKNYNGEANDLRHLSLIERWQLQHR
jgi:MFS family permease